MAFAMNARFAGTCRCGCQFAQGARIHYDRALGWVTGCTRCTPSTRR